MMRMMKRKREQDEEDYKMKMMMEMAEEMAKYVKKLSSHSNQRHHHDVIEATPISVYRPQTKSALTFECKTCNRHFSSFQALGGHRASHKKPRHENENEKENENKEDHKESKKKSEKKHECNICGVVFSMGQALGGHMRRHKALIHNNNNNNNNANDHDVMVLKKSSNSWMFDLNLTPLENDINLLFSTSHA